MRAFIAIEIPTSIQSRIGAFQEYLQTCQANVAWVTPHSIHITLKFLGEISEEFVPSIGDRLAEVTRGFSVFPISVEGSDGFPTLRKPRVLWVGVSQGAEELVTIADRIETALIPLGFPKERRRFHPHLTLGRVRSPQSLDDVAVAMNNRKLRAGSFLATELVLMQSRLHPTGSIHIPLEKFIFPSQF